MLKISDTEMDVIKFMHKSGMQIWKQETIFQT